MSKKIKSSPATEQIRIRSAAIEVAASGQWPTHESKSTSKHFLIAALGASAGGLEALEKFFTPMPAVSGIGFIIVQHLAPDHTSALPELLARCTEMPVEQAQDNVEAAPNRVFIIPPGATLTIRNGRLRVETPVEPRAHRTPIDCLFRSLADDRGENAVCIICYRAPARTARSACARLKSAAEWRWPRPLTPPSTMPFFGAPLRRVWWIMCCRWRRCRQSCWNMWLTCSRSTVGRPVSASR